MGRRLSDLWLVIHHFHAMKNLTRLAVQFERQYPASCNSCNSCNS